MIWTETKTKFERSNAEAVCRVIYNDTESGKKTFSFSFSNEAVDKCFGKSMYVRFGYDPAKPYRLYFTKAQKGYKLNRPRTTQARWYVRPASLYYLVESQGLCSPIEFDGKYMVEYDKEQDAFFVDSKKRVI